MEANAVNCSRNPIKLSSEKEIKMMKYTMVTGSILLAFTLGGCANMTETQKGTGKGAAIGAGTGAVVGAVAGGGKGAAIGAVVGGVVGSVAGNVWSRQIGRAHV